MRSYYRPVVEKKKSTCSEFWDLRFQNKKTEIKFVETFYLQQREFLVQFNLTLVFFLAFAIFIQSEYLSQLNMLMNQVLEIEDCTQ
jgi:hypothetical protein